MNKTAEIIQRVDKYLALTRFQYSTEEQLSRLHILNDYYSTMKESCLEEKLSASIETAEMLGKDLVLPLKVRGVFLTEGRPRRKFYKAEELQKSTDNPINKRFPLMVDHRDKEAGKVIGMVDRIEYDPQIKGVRWYGHINDETFARNVMDGAITQVSATIFSAEEFDPELGVVGTDLTYKELSLVMEGAEKYNSIETY